MMKYCNRKNAREPKPMIGNIAIMGSPTSVNSCAPVQTIRKQFNARIRIAPTVFSKKTVIFPRYCTFRTSFISFLVSQIFLCFHELLQNYYTNKATVLPLFISTQMLF